MRDEAVIDMQEAEEMHEAMDYAQHEATYEGFIGLVKWATIQLALVVIALYCFIEAGQPWIGGLFLAAAVVVPLAGAVLKPRL